VAASALESAKHVGVEARGLDLELNPLEQPSVAICRVLAGILAAVLAGVGKYMEQSSSSSSSSSSSALWGCWEAVSRVRLISSTGTTTGGCPDRGNLPASPWALTPCGTKL